MEEEMEAVNKDAKYIMIDRGDARILVDVIDISALEKIGDAINQKNEPVEIYLVKFTNGMAWQCAIDKEAVNLYNTLKEELKENKD